MKITELRIGNIISFCGKNDVKVLGLDTYNGGMVHTGDLDYEEETGIRHAERGIEDFEPIELGYNWVHNLGLERDFDNSEHSTWDIFSDKEALFFLNADTYQPIDFGYNMLKYEIKFVHELQNVYFAYTGKELEVKKLSRLA